MTGLLAALMVVVALFCLVRAFVSALRPSGHGRDLDAWHVVMAAAMALMLLVTAPRVLSLVLLGVFVVAIAWAVAHLARRATPTAYARLGLGSVAMVAMLLPAALASAASPAVAHVHHGHAGPAAAPAGTSATVATPPVVFAVLVGLLAVVLVVRVAGVLGRRGTLPARLDACCDVAMATAMAWMLVPLA